MLKREELTLKLENVKNKIKTLQAENKIEEGLINTYTTKLKDNVDIETIKTMVNAETWLTGVEASRYFNITVTEANKMIAKVDTNLLNSYKNVPENLLKAEDLAIKNKEIEIALALI